MQYLSLKDDINKLPLSVISAYNLRHNGINTIADLLRIKSDKSYKNFVWHVSEISEIEQWLNNLNTGHYGYIISQPDKHSANPEISINTAVAGKMPQNPSFIDYVKTLQDDRIRNIMLERLSGKTLQEIGGNYGITRERVRQLCNKIFRSRHKIFKQLHEDQYLCVLSKYDISCNDFMLAFNEPVSTYIYCDAVAGTYSPRKPLESILYDENIPENLRTQAKRAIYQGYIFVNGQRIKENRVSLINYYLKEFCRDSMKFADFEESYNAFVDSLGLTDDKNLKVSGRGYMNHLSSSMFTLCSYWQNFRYYDIKARNYNDFLRQINLAQYKGMTISTLRIFRRNPELMKNFDIRDGYELHNLLRKLYLNSINDIQFGRMPIISIGENYSPRPSLIGC